ncbi:MAG: heme-binding protein [Lachnospira pectinoschiza]
MTAKELMKQCEAEEKELKFREFSSETALAIGMALIEEAKNRNNKICIDIAIAGRRLFHYSSDGNAVSNDIMIERKKKTAMHTGHSSLWAHYMLRIAV